MSLYQYSRSANQSTYRSNHPISNEIIAQYAPSILATEAHHTRGERYSFIPTINVIDGLRQNGFEPFEVRQTRVRDQSRREHTKHMVRLRHPDAIGNQSEVPELILLNSHDGTSSYQLLSGFFRMVCSNGLIAGDVTNDIRIRHSGNVVDDVIEGSYQVIENVNHLADRIDQYKSIELTTDEQQLLANAAADVRWGDNNGLFRNSQLLLPRRWEDNKSDLWTTFNRIQENVIKGGMSGRSKTGRRTRTREVGGVSENVKLNRALWTLADEFAKLKTTA
jgi:hypothetical protein